MAAIGLVYLFRNQLKRAPGPPGFGALQKVRALLVGVRAFGRHMAATLSGQKHGACKPHRRFWPVC